MFEPEFRHLAALLKYLPPGELREVHDAFDFAVHAHEGQKREDGTPYVLHVIAVAGILASWHADKDTIIGALLHDTLEDTAAKKEEISEKFGRHVALLVEGITKFTQADLSPELPLDRKIETLRKLFDVMRLDMRSILIKLADRLHNIETIDSLPTPARRRKFAQETLNVYYKIAFHLGMREVRRTFAEYSVPHAFDAGAEEKQRRDVLFKQAEAITTAVGHELKRREGGDRVLKVSAQPRNLLIFHEKVEQRGGTALPQDAYSLNIIVRTEEDCYRLLKTLHTLYRPLSGQFRDFIAAPSDAGYQSLHTTVTYTDGSSVEVRIRTPEMYEQAVRGVTVSLFSHERHIPPTFAWLKHAESLDLQTRDSSSAFWEALESDILRETVPVMVDRKRISLPRGATALDAAYAVYDAKAGMVQSIAVNGRQIALSTPLKEDDEVHLTFGTEAMVGFDWLQLVSTRHARFHIVDVLKKTGKSEKIALGATLLQKELDHYAKGLLSELSRGQCQDVADHFKRESFDQVLSMIGEGVIRARDVVFHLFPEHSKVLAPGKARGQYNFRLHITATVHPGQDVLALLNGLMRMSGVSADTVRVRTNNARGTADILLNGESADRLQFADFIDQLDRQEWVSSAQTLIPYRHKAMLLGGLITAFAVVLLDVVLFPAYQQILGRLSLIPSFMIQALPLIPILAVNYYLVRLIRHYVVRMRSDRWFLAIALLLNLFGLLLLVLRIVLLHEVQGTLLPLIAIFVLSLVYMGYTFLQTDALFAPFDERDVRPISSSEWRSILKGKRVGYFIRLLAVLIWGLEPIYIRYTPVNNLSPSLRTFLLGLGVLIPSGLFYAIRHLWKDRKLPRFSLPYDTTFLILLAGQIGYMYFKNASLIYTSGTNLLLFNNFSPLIGLMIAAFFWRKDISYFRQPRTMLAIFLVAVVAGIGSSMLVYNNSLLSTSWSTVGDVLAMISTFFDVFMTIGQIQYIKNFPKTDGMLLNLHIFFFLVLCTAPVIIAAPYLGVSIFDGLTTTTLLLGLGIGLFVGFGQFLNYEAFKRIDGYLAYMMFNISILITFSLEVFVIHSIKPTFLLLLSTLLIVGASITAELINSKSQKQGC